MTRQCVLCHGEVEADREEDERDGTLRCVKWYCATMGCPHQRDSTFTTDDTPPAWVEVFDDELEP